MGSLSFNQNSPVSIRLTPWASESSDLGRGTDFWEVQAGEVPPGEPRGPWELRRERPPGVPRWGRQGAVSAETPPHRTLGNTSGRRVEARGAKALAAGSPGGSRPQGHSTPAPPVPLSPHARVHRPCGAGPIPRFSAVQSEKGVDPGDLSPNLGSHLATCPP